MTITIRIGSSWRDVPPLARAFSLPASSAVKLAQKYGARRLVYWKRHFYAVEAEAASE